MFFYRKIFPALILTGVVLFGMNVFAFGESVHIILSSDSDSFRQAVDGFREALRESKPGVKIMENNLKSDDPAAIVSQIDQEKPAVVYTVGSDAAKLAREKIKDSPVVCGMIFSCKEYVQDNITGVSLNIPAAMKLQSIKKIVPALKTLGLIYSDASEVGYRDISTEAGDRFQVIGKKISADSEFPVALKELAGQIDCFLMVVDSKVFFSQTVKYLLLDGLKNKYAVIGLSSFYTKAGALMSFDCDYRDVGRQAGELSARIMNGEKASDIKPLRPRKIKYSINTLVAERLQINISPKALKDADEVFN